MPEIISRAEAKARGLKRYFTGKPCIHGHIEERYVSDKSCATCSRLKCNRINRKGRLENPERFRDAVRRSYLKHPEKRRAALKESNSRYTTAVQVLRKLGVIQNTRKGNAETERKKKWLAKQSAEYLVHVRRKNANRAMASYWSDPEKSKERHRARSKMAVVARRALQQLGIKI